MCINFTRATILPGGHSVVYQRGKEGVFLIPVMGINSATAQVAVCTSHCLTMNSWSAVQSFWGHEGVLVPCSMSHSSQSHPLPWQDNSEVSNTSVGRSFTLAGCDPQYSSSREWAFPGEYSHKHHLHSALQSSWMWFMEHKLQQDALKHLRSYWDLAASFNNYCLGAQQLLNTIQTDNFFLSLCKNKRP